MVTREKGDQADVGQFIVRDGILIRPKTVFQLEKKNEVLKVISEADYGSFQQRDRDAKKECKESSTQTQIPIENALNNKRPEALLHFKKIRPKPPRASPALEAAAQSLHKKNVRTGRTLLPLSENASLAIGACVRMQMTRVIEQCIAISEKNCRKKLVPEDLDLAYMMLGVDPNLVCPMPCTSSMTERTFWGRKIVAKPPTSIGLAGIRRTSNEAFTDSITLKDHWLCIDGVQPCLPENVVPAAIKSSAQQDEINRLLGISTQDKKNVDKNVEKRFTKQMISMEHQVFFNEIVNVVTSGTPAERQRTLQTLETDRGLQFLVGRFVILIAEGIRVNIASKNIAAITNLIKLTWSIIKNPHVKLDRFLYILLPTIVTCVVVKTMTASNGEDEENSAMRDQLELEFKMRETCSKLLANLCDRFEVLRLRVRVITLLRNVFTMKTHPTTIYGALCTLFAMGYLPVKTIVVPRLHDIYINLFPPTRLMHVRNSMGIAHLKLVELVMKILHEYEACNGAEKRHTEASLKESYGEFGAMLFRYLNQMEKIKPTGELIIDKTVGCLISSYTSASNLEDLCVGTVSMRSDVGGAMRPGYSQYSNISTIKRNAAPDISEDMLLENLLDDADHPWADVANKIQHEGPTLLGVASGSGEGGEKVQCSGLVNEPKLVLVKKSKSATGEGHVTYLRPIEPLKIPVPPPPPAVSHPAFVSRMDSVIGGPAPIGSLGSRSMSVRLSRVMSVDDVNAQQSQRDPAEVLRRFISRGAPQAAAAVYGKAMESSSTGRQALDQQISDASFRLSNVKMRNAIVYQRNPSVNVVVKSRGETAVGKFLVPTADRGNRL